MFARVPYSRPRAGWPLFPYYNILLVYYNFQKLFFEKKKYRSITNIPAVGLQDTYKTRKGYSAQTNLSDIQNRTYYFKKNILIRILRKGLSGNPNC
jgi:hypothetical protein